MIRRTFRPVHPGYTPDSVVEVESDSDDAVLISSLLTDVDDCEEDLHAPVLDLDAVGARFVQSSTEGNGHLYLDGIKLTVGQYRSLLAVLVECGIIQPGFAKQLDARGFTAVRRPGLKKGDPKWEHLLSGDSGDGPALPGDFDPELGF